MRLKLLSLCMLLAMVLPAGSAQPRLGEDNVFIYCTLVDNVHNIVYFSNIFLGDSSNDDLYEESFHDQVRRLSLRAYGVSRCFVADNDRDARAAKSTKALRYRGVYRTLIETGWTF